MQGSLLNFSLQISVCLYLLVNLYIFMQHALLSLETLQVRLNSSPTCTVISSQIIFRESIRKSLNILNCKVNSNKTKTLSFVLWNNLTLASYICHPVLHHLICSHKSWPKLTISWRVQSTWSIFWIFTTWHSTNSHKSKIDLKITLEAVWSHKTSPLVEP